MASSPVPNRLGREGEERMLLRVGLSTTTPTQDRDAAATLAQSFGLPCGVVLANRLAKSHGVSTLDISN
jgi:hypothetical protein